MILYFKFINNKQKNRVSKETRLLLFKRKNSYCRDKGLNHTETEDNLSV